MISLEVSDKKRDIKDHFTITADKPMRVEVTLTTTGHLVAFVYEGTELDLEQEPVGGYNSDVENIGWKHHGETKNRATTLLSKVVSGEKVNPSEVIDLCKVVLGEP